MPSLDWRDLVDAYRHGEISRRDLIRHATAAGISIGAATLLSNQVTGDAPPEASPVTGASPAVIDSSATGAAQPGGRSINREEYYALIHRSFDLSEPEIAGGKVIYGASSDIDTLNPQLAFDVFSGWVTGGIYEYLVNTNPTNGFPAPGLADYWELSDDGLTYTFHLNRNATWHDGEPVTADDVVFSFDAALDESSLGGYQSTVGRALESYRAADDHTVELVAKGPVAIFVESTAWLVGILPKHIWESVPPSDWGSDTGSTGRDPARVVGSGPFRFVERAAGSHVTLARNGNYWDPDAIPNIDEFIFRVMRETLGASAALTTGEVDIARIAPGDADALKKDSELNVVAYDETGWRMLNMNQDPEKTGLFVDFRVRQALLYALDRQLIVEEIYLGYATLANGTQPPLSIAYAPDRIDTIYTYDPEKAKQLLEEAGWIDSDGDGIREKDGVTFSFECLYASNVSTYRQLLTYMQQAWGEVGIDMQPVARPFQTFYDVLTTGDYEMGIHGIGSRVDGSQGDLFRCDAVPPAGFNTMTYCNPRYDELDVRQLAELDVEKRIDLLIEQSNILNDEVAAGLLVFDKSLVGSLRTLHNFLPNGNSFLWSMPWWWTEVQ